MVVRSAEHRIRSARAEYYPSVGLSASHEVYGEDYFLGTDDPENEFRLQVEVSINLFNGFATPARVKRALLDVKGPRFDLYELKQTLDADLKNTLLDYDVARKNIDVAQASIFQAEENLRITDISFEQGVATAADVLDAIFYLSRARYNRLNAQNGLFLDYYRLQRLIDDL